MKIVTLTQVNFYIKLLNIKTGSEFLLSLTLTMIYNPMQLFKHFHK